MWTGPVKGSEGGAYSDIGKLKSLNMMCSERWSQFPNIPTPKEQGDDIESYVIFLNIINNHSFRFTAKEKNQFPDLMIFF